MNSIVNVLSLSLPLCVFSVYIFNFFFPHFLLYLCMFMIEDEQMAEFERKREIFFSISFVFLSPK